MKTVGVLTSGGDSPGMNAAIRSLTRTALTEGYRVFGIMRGYQGLLQDDIEELNMRSVSNIMQRGGTILKTSRCLDFKTFEGLSLGKKILEKHGIDSLVVIGGDGTFRGALELSKIWDGKVIGIPGTIDNDLFGTDFTLGYDTAVNTAVDAIDKIRDTAESHERIFLIEVMGRNSGYIALDVCIASGSEDVFLPEKHNDIHDQAKRILEWKRLGKTSCIIIVAEGNREGSATQIAEKLTKLTHFEFRVVTLGYIQRGGIPSPRDRLLGTKLGAFAIYSLDQNFSKIMVGESHAELVRVPLEKAIHDKKPLNKFLCDLIPILAH